MTLYLHIESSLYAIQWYNSFTMYLVYACSGNREQNKCHYRNRRFCDGEKWWFKLISNLHNDTHMRIFFFMWQGSTRPKFNFPVYNFLVSQLFCSLLYMNRRFKSLIYRQHRLIDVKLINNPKSPHPPLLLTCSAQILTVVSWDWYWIYFWQFLVKRYILLNYSFRKLLHREKHSAK